MLKRVSLSQSRRRSNFVRPAFDLGDGLFSDRHNARRLHGQYLESSLRQQSSLLGILCTQIFGVLFLVWLTPSPAEVHLG
ncbi:hypothetical protein EMIT0P265_300004 [Pseudomonas zeae]